MKRAADELSVTSPAVSHQVKQFEDWLTRAVFERRVRGLDLTDTGRQVFEATNRSLFELSLALNRVRRSRANSGRSLRVSLTPALASLWLVHRLDGFLSKRMGAPYM